MEDSTCVVHAVLQFTKKLRFVTSYLPLQELALCKDDVGKLEDVSVSALNTRNHQVLHIFPVTVAATTTRGVCMTNNRKA